MSDTQIKSQFKTACIVQVGDGSNSFRLVQELVYYSEILGRDIVVPVGFDTDFASIPKLLRWLIDVNGKHRKAAVVHDFLCVYGKSLDIPQRTTDAIFNEAMGVVEVRPTQRYPMYWGVRGYQSVKGLFA